MVNEDVMESNDEKIVTVYETMAATAERDVDWFLDRLASCDDERKTRDLVRSFRKQMILCAAGEALARC
jgi:hypothetical protein